MRAVLLQFGLNQFSTNVVAYC